MPGATNLLCGRQVLCCWAMLLGVARCYAVAVWPRCYTVAVHCCCVVARFYVVAVSYAVML